MTIKIGFQQKLEIEVVEQAKHGDPKAFEAIYRAYISPAQNLSYSICRNIQTAQDVAHDVFLKAFKNLPGLKDSSQVGSWLKRIVVNETINKLRSGNRLEFVEQNEIEAHPTSDLFTTQWLDSCKDLSKLLDKLPDTSRAVLILHEVEGYNHSEIAELFNKSESFSKVTLSRAYKHLKERAQKLSQEFNHAS